MHAYTHAHIFYKHGNTFIHTHVDGHEHKLIDIQICGQAYRDTDRQPEINV